MNGIAVTVVQRHKHEGSQVWYARIRNARTGKTRYVSMKTTRRTEAQLLANDMLRDGEFDDKGPAEKMTFKEGLEQYEKYLRSKGTTEASIRTYENLLLKFRHLFGMKISTLTKDFLFSEFARIFGESSPGYYNHGRTLLRGVFGYFSDVLEIIERNPFRQLPRRKGRQKERKFWTLEQIRSILDAVKDPQTRVLWAFMAYEGLRIHEALKLRREDIREDGVHIVGKGGKYARLPLSSLMKSELDRVGWLWDFSRLSKQLSLQRLSSVCRRLFDKKKEGEATNHRFRHSFASNLIRAGANIKAVQLLMRHSSVTITLNLYSHLMDNDLEAGIEKLAENEKNAKMMHSFAADPENTAFLKNL